MYNIWKYDYSFKCLVIKISDRNIFLDHISFQRGLWPMYDNAFIIVNLEVEAEVGLVLNALLCGS